MGLLGLINESRKGILRKKIYQDIEKTNPKKILDNGCGKNGSFDYREFKDRITRADVLYGINCEKLPYKSKSFDCVIFAGVIQYVDNPEKAMKECFRVLKNNGILIIATINKDSLVKKLTGFKTERQVFTMREFGDFLERFKFKVLTKKYVDF
jgi:SAM-dependent methyltransferase